MFRMSCVKKSSDPLLFFAKLYVQGQKVCILFVSLAFLYQYLQLLIKLNFPSSGPKIHSRTGQLTVHVHEARVFTTRRM